MNDEIAFGFIIGIVSAIATGNVAIGIALGLLSSMILAGNKYHG